MEISPPPSASPPPTASAPSATARIRLASTSSSTPCPPAPLYWLHCSRRHKEIRIGRSRCAVKRWTLLGLWPSSLVDEFWFLDGLRLLIFLINFLFVLEIAPLIFQDSHIVIKNTQKD